MPQILALILFLNSLAIIPQTLAIISATHVTLNKSDTSESIT